MDRITSMTVFCRVASSGSFAGAARRLNMSPAAVTTHIRALEDRLGTRLLNRTTRKVSLTEAGGAYFERCAQILGEIEEAEHAATELQSNPRGTLRLNLSMALAEPLAPFVAEFMIVFPEVAIDMTVTERMVDLVEERFDLAIRAGQLADSSLIVRRLLTIRLVLCASPAYLEKFGTPQRPTDLENHNCLTFQRPPNEEWSFQGPGGVETVQIGGTLHANNPLVLRAAVLRGIGLAMLSRYFVAEDLRSGALVPVMTEFGLTEIAVQAIYPHSHRLSAKVRTFVDFLAERFVPSAKRRV